LYKANGFNYKVLSDFTAKSAVITVVFLILFLPWSYSLHLKFGGTYLTTITMDIGMVYRFSNQEFKKTIVPNKKPTIQRMHLYYWNKAIDENMSYSEAIKEDKNEIMAAISTDSFKKVMRKNLKNIFFKPTQLLKRFNSKSKKKLPESTRNCFYHPVYNFNKIIWYISLFVCGIYFFFFYSPVRIENNINLLIKLFLIGISFQLFFIGGHARHSTSLYSLFIFLISFLITKKSEPIISFFSSMSNANKVNILIQYLMLFYLIAVSVFFLL
jgi:hypothetical protein